MDNKITAKFFCLNGNHHEGEINVDFLTSGNEDNDKEYSDGIYTGGLQLVVDEKSPIAKLLVLNGIYKVTIELVKPNAKFINEQKVD